MTTPLILNVVIVTTKCLLHVYYCQQSILAQFNVPQVLYSEPRQFLSSGTKRHISGFKGHIRDPKGHSALWKRPSENPALNVVTPTDSYLAVV